MENGVSQLQCRDGEFEFEFECNVCTVNRGEANSELMFRCVCARPPPLGPKGPGPLEREPCAQRKALRFGRVGAFVPVLKTALWSNALNWTSVLVVDWVFILGECVVQPSAGKKTVGGAPKQKKPVLEAVKEAAGSGRARWRTRRRTR